MQDLAERPADVDSPPAVVLEKDPAALQDKARKAYLASLDGPGEPLTGEEVGELFNRGGRWGRDRIKEARESLPRQRRRQRSGSRAAAATASAPAVRRRVDGTATGTANGSADGTATATATADPVAVERQSNGIATEPAAAAPTAEPAAPATAAVATAGGRFVAWLGFVFGSVISIAANVLHAWVVPPVGSPPDWTPSVASQIGAAVWPVALLISVEVLSRVPWPSGWLWALGRYGVLGTVALGSFLISYGHLFEVLEEWNYTWIGTVAGPIVVDGLMVISGFALLAISRNAKGAGGST